MAAGQPTHERYVAIPLPGIEGVSLIYDPAATPFEAPRLEAAVTLLSRWLQQRTVSLTPRVVRAALRHLNSPGSLSETELAQAIFGPIPITGTRGDALRLLLLRAIAQLDCGRTASVADRRGYLILRQLYIERKPRLRIIHDLNLSERQYQRELNNALARLADILAGSL